MRPGASPEACRAAYRRLVRVHHPDAHPDATGAERAVHAAALRQVVVAYEALAGPGQAVGPADGPGWLAGARRRRAPGATRRRPRRRARRPGARRRRAAQLGRCGPGAGRDRHGPGGGVVRLVLRERRHVPDRALAAVARPGVRGPARLHPPAVLRHAPEPSVRTHRSLRRQPPPWRPTSTASSTRTARPPARTTGPSASSSTAPASNRPARGFRAALEAAPGLAVIAEIKRRSPSKGDLNVGLDPADVGHDLRGRRGVVPLGAHRPGVLRRLAGRPEGGQRGDPPAGAAEGLHGGAPRRLRRPADGRRLRAADRGRARPTPTSAGSTTSPARSASTPWSRCTTSPSWSGPWPPGATLVGVNQRDLVTFEVDPSARRADGRRDPRRRREGGRVGRPRRATTPAACATPATTRSWWARPSSPSPDPARTIQLLKGD